MNSISFSRASLNSMKIYPRSDVERGEIGVIVNGHESINFTQEELSKVVNRINECSLGIILVDGGANYFCSLQAACSASALFITAPLISFVGDQDSITHNSLAYLKATYPDIDIVKLARDKHLTDLEAALMLIKTTSQISVTIFNALGGRLDQFLGNLFCLFGGRNHIEIWSLHERVFRELEQAEEDSIDMGEDPLLYR